MTNLLRQVDRRLGQFQEIKKRHKGLTTKLTGLQERQAELNEALGIVRTVAQATQEEIKFQFMQIATVAISSVFEEDIAVDIDFVQRRGKTEADIWFVKNDERFNPFTEDGGGAVDVAAFALRVALWKLQLPKVRNTLILDEPFKFVSVDLQKKVGDMLRVLNEKLGLQIIMVTHLPELIDAADKVFVVTQKNDISKVGAN